MWPKRSRQGVIVQVSAKNSFVKDTVRRLQRWRGRLQVSERFVQTWNCVNVSTRRRFSLSSGRRGFYIRTFWLHKIVTPRCTDDNVSWRFHVQPFDRFLLPLTRKTAAKRMGYTRRDEEYRPQQGSWFENCWFSTKIQMIWRLSEKKRTGRVQYDDQVLFPVRWTYASVSETHTVNTIVGFNFAKNAESIGIDKSKLAETSL